MAKEKRLIDANELADSHWWESLTNDFDKARARIIVMSAPTVDAVEVVHARWAFIGEECCVCSACHNASPVDYYYCPECGAKMDLEE